MKEATTAPSTAARKGHMCSRSVLALPHREGSSGQACGLGFLDGASAIWLSWSADSSQHLLRLSGPSSVKLCHWTPKQRSQTTFQLIPPNVNSFSPSTSLVGNTGISSKTAFLEFLLFHYWDSCSQEGIFFFQETSEWEFWAPFLSL